MEQGHKVLFILLGLAIVACLLGWRSIPVPAPALIATPHDDADDMVLGDSAVAGSSTKGPTYLGANVPLFFPPPLAHLNPVTSTQTGT